MQRNTYSESDLFVCLFVCSLLFQSRAVRLATYQGTLHTKLKDQWSLTCLFPLASICASSSLALMAAVAMSSVSWPSCEVSLQCRQMVTSHLQHWKHSTWSGWNWHICLLPAGLGAGLVATGLTEWLRAPPTRSCRRRQERHMCCWHVRQKKTASSSWPSSHMPHSTGVLDWASSSWSTAASK